MVLVVLTKVVPKEKYGPMELVHVVARSEREHCRIGMDISVICVLIIQIGILIDVVIVTILQPHSLMPKRDNAKPVRKEHLGRAGLVHVSELANEKEN